MPTEPMNVDSLLKRICNTDRTGGCNARKLTFFLGAGCSIGSGIQGAAGLARMWWESMEPHQKQSIWNYTDARAGEFYNKIVETKFRNNHKDRQEELARIMRDARPGFGYIALATLIQQSTRWSCRDERLSPVVLTTNFDDLLERAFLIYTSVVPVVVAHDSLVDYTTSSRCIIKLHGDYRFNPYTDDETTKTLSAEVLNRIGAVVHGSDIVFIGYGGNDPGVASLIKNCINARAFSTIYWVNANAPGKAMEDAFSGATAYHVVSSFDDLMAKMLRFTNVEAPSTCRLMGHIDNYHEHFFAKMMEKQPSSASTKTPSYKFQDWFHFVQKAIGHAQSGAVNEAERIMEKGMKYFKYVSSYRMYCAHILYDFKINLDKANFHYRWAIRLDHGNGRAKANYAPFLIHNDRYIGSVTPDEYLKQAIEIDGVDMNSIINLSGYLFLKEKTDEANGWLDRARRYPLSDINCLEADFYELAHAYSEKREVELLRRIGRSLENGVKPHNYLYEANANVARASYSGDHPLGDLVTDIAAVMGGKLEASRLARHDRFREAGRSR